MIKIRKITSSKAFRDQVLAMENRELICGCISSNGSFNAVSH